MGGCFFNPNRRTRHVSLFSLQASASFSFSLVTFTPFPFLFSVPPPPSPRPPQHLSHPPHFKLIPGRVSVLTSSCFLCSCFNQFLFVRCLLLLSALYPVLLVYPESFYSILSAHILTLHVSIKKIVSIKQLPLTRERHYELQIGVGGIEAYGKSSGLP